MDTDTLLSQIRDFCERSGMKPTVFGLKAVNDGKLVRRLEEGRECLPRTTARIIRFIETAEAAQ